MNKSRLLLVAIFALTLSFRLFLALRERTLDYSAYFHLRQIESIIETGFPAFNGLSYSPHFFIPGFDYILAIVAFVVDPVLVLKIVPNIFASLLVFVTFALSFRITKNTTASLIAAFASGFIPVFVSSANSASPFSLAIPLVFFSLYCFIRVNEKKYAYLFLASTVTLTLISPIVLLLIGSLLLYYFLSKAEGLKRNPAESEVILLTGLFSVWLTFLVFKQPLIEFGLGAVWQNAPPELFETSFANIDVLAMMMQIGVISSIAGIFVVYRYILRQRNTLVYVLISPVLSILFLLGVRLVSVETALLVLGPSFAVLFSLAFFSFQRYVNKTRLHHFNTLMVSLTLLLLLIIHVYPSYVSFYDEPRPTAEDIVAMQWLTRASPGNAVILTSVQEGHLVTAVAERHNVIDDVFLFADDVPQRFEDIRIIYTTKFQTEALDLLKEYDVDYIYLSTATSARYGVDSLFYASNRECFPLVYRQGALIYQVMCEVES